MKPKCVTQVSKFIVDMANQGTQLSTFLDQNTQYPYPTYLFAIRGKRKRGCSNEICSQNLNIYFEIRWLHLHLQSAIILLSILL